MVFLLTGILILILILIPILMIQQIHKVELLDFSICNDDDYLFIKIRCDSEID